MAVRVASPATLRRVLTPPAKAGALAVAARIVREARDIAPVDTGEYRARMFARTTSTGAQAVASAQHSRYVEEGNRPKNSPDGRIRPRRAKALRFKPKGSATFIFRKSVKSYPGFHTMRDAARRVARRRGVRFRVR